MQTLYTNYLYYWKKHCSLWDRLSLSWPKCDLSQLPPYTINKLDLCLFQLLSRIHSIFLNYSYYVHIHIQKLFWTIQQLGRSLSCRYKTNFLAHSLLKSVLQLQLPRIGLLLSLYFCHNECLCGKIKLIWTALLLTLYRY